MGLKGGFVANEKMWILVIIIGMVFLLAVWLLLNNYFVGYVSENIVSDSSLCETFDKVPVLGTIQCPN